MECLLLTVTDNYILSDIYRKKHSMKYVFMRNEKIRIIILIIKVDRFYFRFHIVGVRMLWLTEEQAQNMLHINDAGSFTLVSSLCVKMMPFD